VDKGGPLPDPSRSSHDVRGATGVRMDVEISSRVLELPYVLISSPRIGSESWKILRCEASLNRRNRASASALGLSCSCATICL
jgi:hypothetical protein